MVFNYVRSERREMNVFEQMINFRYPLADKAPIWIKSP